MKKIRCTLLCLTFLLAVCLLSGCRSRQEEPTTSFPAQTSSGASGESSAAPGTSGAAVGTSGAADGTSYEYENGAGSMSTDEGASLPGAGTDSGLIEDLGDDISDAIDDLGDDITNASNDGNARSRGTGR